MIFHASHSLEQKEANSIKKGPRIIAEIREVVRQWRDYAEQVKVPEALTDAIDGCD